MRLMQPLPVGSLEGARARLVEAQGFAADVANAPTTDTLVKLEGGIAAAKAAARELFVAEPRSPYQDLVAARQQVLAGASLLEQAISAYGSAHGVDPTPQVKHLAGGAFDAFENAFEIIDND